jgi:hypothetical protein
MQKDNKQRKDVKIGECLENFVIYPDLEILRNCADALFGSVDLQHVRVKFQKYRYLNFERI